MAGMECSSVSPQKSPKKVIAPCLESLTRKTKRPAESLILEKPKRTSRFNTDKTRLIDRFLKLGELTGCYGFLYLRR